MATTTTTIAVDDPLASIGYAEIGINISTTWTGNVNIAVESPAGTNVGLNLNYGSTGDNFHLIYSDLGVPNTSPVVNFDCGGCRMQTAVNALPLDSVLGDFIGEDPNGDWDLTTVLGTFGAAELNEYCVIIWAVSPVEDLTCVANLVDDPDTAGVDESVGHVNVSFTAGAAYTSVEILNYTDLVETMLDDFVTGDTYEVTIGPLPVPQVASLEVIGIVDDDISAPFACAVPIHVAPLECLEGSEGDIVGTFGGVGTDPGPMYIDIVEFSEEFDITDITVQVDITYDFMGDLDVAIAAPFDTVVMLHNHRGGSSATGIDVLYWELGPTGASLTGGNAVHTTGPGTLNDFVGGTTHNEDGIGAWALVASARTVSATFGDGTVNSWTLCVYDTDPAFRPEGVACEEGDILGTVSASAIVGAAYNKVRWFVNGEVAEEVLFDPPLAAGVDGITFTTEPQPLPSFVTIGVQGFIREGDDEVPSPVVSCSRRVFLPGPVGMSCIQEPGLFEITASWSLSSVLPDGYDGYNVYVDGEFVEILTDGSATTYATDEGFEVNTVHTVSVEGFLDDPLVISDLSTCFALMLAEMEIVECSDVPAVAAGTLGLSTSTVSVLDLGTVEEVEVFVDGCTTFFQGLNQTLSHDETGSSLVLHDSLGSRDPDYCMLWTDDGDTFTFTTDLDGCLALLPQGGTFVDAFSNDVSDGDWTLTSTTDSATFEYGVNSWCLRMNICEILPPTDLVADVIDSDIFLTWTNDVTSDYTEVLVYLNGDLFDSLDGDAEEVSLFDVEDGHHQLAVAGFSDVTDCEARTPSVPAGIGFSETCVSDLAVADSIVDITVFESVIIADIELVLDLETTFGTGGWDLSLTSPFGTTVALHRRLGGSGPKIFQLIYSSREDSDPRGNGVPYDCDFCIMNPHLGDLDDFQGEIADGTWEWEMAVGNPSFGTGDLNLACIDVYEGCTGVPPSDLLAEVDETDILLSWLNNGDDPNLAYVSLKIERNGVIIAEELDVEEESYRDVKPLSGFYTYRIIAVVIDPDTLEECDAGSAPSDEVAKGILVECMEDDSVAIGLVATSIEVEVFEDPTPDDIRVVLDISFAFIPYLDIFIENPDGDDVKLFTGLGLVPGNLIRVDIDRTFADSGEGQPAFDYIDGSLIQPSGPGKLEDFLDGSIIGIWTLDITASFTLAGTLNTYCMQLLVGCPLERPSIDSCIILDDNSLPPIELTFSGIDPAVIDSIQIVRNGVVIATLDSDATDYLDEEITGTGRQIYRVVAFDDELDCGKPSSRCESEAIGRYTVCEEADLALTNGGLSVSGLEFAYDDGTGVRPNFEFEEDSLIGEVEVDIDLTTSAWVGGVDIWLMSPDRTVVTLNRTRGGSTGDDLRVTYSDEASAVLTATNSTCECLIRPEGPGRMSDFAGEDPEDGQWFLLSNFGNDIFGPMTLNDWCLGIFPDKLPVPDLGIEFLRGDVDNNGTVSALSDGLRILRWGSGNAPPPPCMAAADVDANGSVSALADGLRLLRWGSGGAPPPPAPFPKCGLDPDDENLEDSPACDTDGDGENDGGKGCAGDPGA